MSAVGGSWSLHLNARQGPFEAGGNVYAFVKDASSGVQAYRSADSGASWTALNQTGSLSLNLITHVDAVQVGDTIHVCATGNFGEFKVVPFDTTTETWGAATPAGGATADPGHVSGNELGFLAVRSDGSYVVFHQSDSERIMGSDYRRMGMSVWDGAAMTRYDLNNSLAFQSGVQTNFDARATILARVDYVHILFTAEDRGLVSRTLTINNLLSTDESIIDASVSNTDNYPVGLPATYGEGSDIEMAIPHAMPSGLNITRAMSTLVPDWLTNVASASSSEVITSNPAALIYDDAGVLHAFAVRQDNGAIEYSNDQGTGTWMAPELFAIANTQGISVKLIDGGGAIGVLYDDGGTVTFDKFILAEPPAAPTLVGPANASTQSGDVTFEWSFNPGEPDDVQGGFALCVKDAPWAFGLVDTVPDTPTLPNTGRGAAFSPDGAYLAITHSDSPYLTIINTSDWSVVPGTPALPNTGRVAAFSPDGTHLAVAHVDTPFLTIINTSDWSVVPGTPILSNTGESTAFSPNGAYLAVAHVDTPFLTIINTSDWSVVPGTPALPNTGRGATFSPDGAYLAIGHVGTPYLTILDASDWSVVSGTPIIPLTGYKPAFSPDGAYLAVAHAGGPYLTIINTFDWSIVPGTPALSGTGYGATFSPDGTYLAVAHFDAPNITILDASDWSVVSDIPTLPSTGRGVDFSPDGAYLAAAHSGIPYLTVIMEGHIDQWWDGVGWNSEEIFIESSQTQITIPSGAWTENE